MPGIVNLPSARVTAAYSVPEGRCTLITRAPSSGAPEESVTTPATAAVVTPCAVIARTGANTTTAGKTPIADTKRFIGMGRRRAEKRCARARQKCLPPEGTSIRPNVTFESRRTSRRPQPYLIHGHAGENDQEREPCVERVLPQRVAEHVQRREHEQRRHHGIAEHPHRTRHHGGRAGRPHPQNRPPPRRV